MESEQDNHLKSGRCDSNGDGETDAVEKFTVYQQFPFLADDATQTETRERKRKLRKRSLIALAAVMILGVAAVLIHGYIKDKPYREALKLFEEDRYQDSLTLLGDVWIDGSPDVVPLMDAVRAFKEYDAGNVKEAYERLDSWSRAYKKNQARYLPAQSLEKITSFRTRVSAEYEQIKAEELKEWAEQAERARRQFQKERDEAREKLKDRLPYIGMDESFMPLTRLGNYAYYTDQNRNDHSYRIYIFKNSKGRETYAVTCENRVVTKVYDKLNNRSLTANNTWTSTRSARTSKSASEDPYNAKDYSNEEDFYDDHWNDFFDYYEAEEYWQDHQ